MVSHNSGKLNLTNQTRLFNTGCEHRANHIVFSEPIWCFCSFCFNIIYSCTQCLCGSCYQYTQLPLWSPGLKWSSAFGWNVVLWILQLQKVQLHLLCDVSCWRRCWKILDFFSRSATSGGLWETFKQWLELFPLPQLTRLDFCLKTRLFVSLFFPPLLLQREAPPAGRSWVSWANSLRRILHHLLLLHPPILNTSTTALP